MVIDTSAIIAILFKEPEADAFRTSIAEAPIRRMSAVSWFEAAMVVEGRHGPDGGQMFDLWLHKARVEIVPVDLDQADEARRAWRRFGKGRHPAGLNFGDCFAYALAKLDGEPLLFKGDDFAQTDVAAA